MRELRRKVGDLRAHVAAEGHRIFQSWRPEVHRPSFAASALNLAHYRALRHRDIRPLQRSLMRWGLSSLGRLEGRVLAGLDAVDAALERVAGGHGRPTARFPTERQFFRGEARLRAHALELFGPPSSGREGRILVTLSAEAASSPDHVLDLARRGMDIARINCAHDDEFVWATMIENLRRAERALGRQIRILMDIAGPKCRTAEVWTAADRKRVLPGDRLLLCRSAIPEGNRFPFGATCSMPEVIDRLAVGARVYVDDGRFAGRVDSIDEAGAVLLIERAKVHGAKLKPEKA